MQVYDNKRPYINTEILKDIKTLNKKQDISSVQKFITDLSKSNFLCAMISHGSTKDMEAFSPFLLMDAESKELVFAIFTNELELKRGASELKQYTTYIMDFNDVLEIFTVINQKTPISIVIDPYGTNFILTKNIIDSVRGSVS